MVIQLAFLVLLSSSFHDVFRERMLEPIFSSIKHQGIVAFDEEPLWDEDGVRFLPLDPRHKLSTDVVSFSGVFANGTVLQRAPNRAAIFGMAPPNSKVAIMIMGDDGSKSSATAQSNADGEWKFVFPKAYPAGGNFTVVAGEAWMTNVTFGDVWFCAGQSNMELAMHYTVSFNETWAAYQNGSYRNIRLYSMPHTNQLDEDLTWIIPPYKTAWLTNFSKDDLSPFYSPCWYFAQELTNRLGAAAPPIGLVGTAIGGTMVEAWTRNHTLDACGMDGWMYNASVCRDKPGFNCGSLFNGMVAPWVNFTIKGALWYQGENNMHEDKGNVKNNTGYACMFNIMKDQWREYWSQVPGTTDPEFGFGIVTLAQGTDEGGKNMANMRWAQTQNYGVVPNPLCRNCFMAQGYDIGDPWNGKGCWAHGNNRCTGWSQTVPFSSTRTPYYMGSIHPRVKFEVGRRLAVAAMNVIYGRKDLPHSGPTIAWCKFQRGKNSLDFTVQFNTTLMNPAGIHDMKQYQLYVDTPPFPNMLDHPMEVNVNDTWIGVGLNRANTQAAQAGQVSFSYPDAQARAQGIRFAWDTPGGCCPTMDTAYFPCIPRSCPIMQKFNTTYDPDNIQTGLELGLPANPFIANLVWDDDKSGHCECLEPQVCH